MTAGAYSVKSVMPAGDTEKLFTSTFHSHRPVDPEEAYFNLSWISDDLADFEMR